MARGAAAAGAHTCLTHRSGDKEYEQRAATRALHARGWNDMTPTQGRLKQCLPDAKAGAHTCVHAVLHTLVHTHTYIYTHARTHPTRTHTHAHARTHAHTQMRTHTHTMAHTHMHTYPHARNPRELAAILVRTCTFVSTLVSVGREETGEGEGDWICLFFSFAYVLHGGAL